MTQVEHITETINFNPNEPTPQISLSEAAVIATEKIAESFTTGNTNKFGAKQLESI